MKFMIPKLLLIAAVCCTLALTLPRFAVTAEAPTIEGFVIEDPATVTLKTNGKKAVAENFSNTYQHTSWKHAAISDLLNKEVGKALIHNKDLFKFRSKKELYQIDNLSIYRDDLMQTVELLQNAMNKETVNPAELFDLNQIKGRDNKGSVHFTGYYTPVLKVSKEKTGPYQYPLYARPKNYEGKLPSRGDIDGKGVLKNKGLEIAYAKHPVDVYFMQVQGSGFVEYPDGSQSLLSYDGNNKRGYRSIGRYLIAKGYTTKDKVSINSIKKFLRENPDKMDEVLFSNPSYVFFKEGQGKVKGTGVTPLTAGHSIAVDPKYIPLGSTLLAKVPIADNKGKFLHHEYRILFAQDTGGAINGAGHVDLYTGIGRKAKRLAMNTHHYGELWLISPKMLNTRP